MPRPGRGSNTTPAVPIFAVSGWSSVLPPICERCWFVPKLEPAFTPSRAHSLAVFASSVLGPLGGAVSHGSSTSGKLSALPEYSSATFGARNAVPYVPRNDRPPAVRNSADALYVAPEPKLL